MNNNESSTFADEEIKTRTVVETTTYPPDRQGVSKVVTNTITYTKSNSNVDDNTNNIIENKYLDEQHKNITENSKAQEKLIMQISVILIGSTLTYSKLLETTDMDNFTITGIYFFIATIITATLSYSLATFVGRTLLEQARIYYEDNTGTIEQPKLEQFKSEKLRRVFDYTTAFLFCLALPLTFAGISNQYKKYHELIKKEKLMSTKQNNEQIRSLDPKPVTKKPDQKPTSQPNNKEIKK